MSATSPSSPSPAEAYESYIVPAMFAPFVSGLLAHARPQPGERVLDLACGTGVVARRIAPLVAPSGSVDALDLNDAMLAVGRETSLREGVDCTFHQGDMVALPFDSEIFDLVTCQQGLQFVEDRRAAVSEMRRVIRPGGRCVVSCWSSIEHHPLSRAIATSMERHSGAARIDAAFALGNAHELSALFRSAGFRGVEISTMTLPVHFPDPDQYVEMAVSGAIAANPKLQQMPADERNRLIDTIRTDLTPKIRGFIVGNEVVSTKQTKIVRAVA